MGKPDEFKRLHKYCVVRNMSAKKGLFWCWLVVVQHSSMLWITSQTGFFVRWYLKVESICFVCGMLIRADVSCWMSGVRIKDRLVVLPPILVTWHLFFGHAHVHTSLLSSFRKRSKTHTHALESTDAKVYLFTGWESLGLIPFRLRLDGVFVFGWTRQRCKSFPSWKVLFFFLPSLVQFCL